MLTRLLPALFGALRMARLLRFPLLERVYLAAFFFYKRHYEDPFAGLAARRPDLFRGGHVLDVGANVGYTASVFASRVEPPFRVYSFEPEPANAARLRRVIARLGLEDRVEPVEAAVGDRCGEIPLVLNEGHPGDHRVAAGEPAGPSVTVPLLSLDSFAAARGLDPVVFVKIDVQGFEMAVSRGMERLLAAQPRLAVAFEFDDSAARAYGWDLQTILSFYGERGFALYALDRRGALRDAREPWSGGGRGYLDVLALRGQSLPAEKGARG